MKILLVNNESSAADMGPIARADELGLAVPSYNILNLRRVLEQYGDVTVCHYKDLPHVSFRPDCAFLSGRWADWDAGRIEEEFSAELKLIREGDLPIFGICAGIQIIAFAFGAPCVWMKKKSGEHGYLPLPVLKEHPLTRGLSGTMTVFEHHGEEAAFAPEEFELLSSTRLCKVEMIAHREKKICGTQFHPEFFTDRYPDGKILLENFLREYVKQ